MSKADDIKLMTSSTDFCDKMSKYSKTFRHTILNEQLIFLYQNLCVTFWYLLTDGIQTVTWQN